MKPKLLGKEHEYWLKENYTLYENSVLAKKLTDMVRESYSKEHEELVRLLPSLSNERIRENVSKRILFLRAPITITVENVKAAARRLNCPQKPLALRSKVNKRSAQTRHIKRWAQEAIHVESPFLWFRTLKIGKSYVVKCTGVKHMRNFMNYVIKWNKDEGVPQNIALHAEPYKEELIVRVRARVYIKIDEL